MQRIVVHVFAVCFILSTFVCRLTSGSLNPCWVSYKNIREMVPYCAASSWVHCDCRNTCTGLSTQWNSIKRVRALCCSSSDCIAECNFTKGFGEDTQYCGKVCPPFFTLSSPLMISTGPISTTRILSNVTQGKRQSHMNI